MPHSPLLTPTPSRQLMHEMLQSAFDSGQTVIITVRGQHDGYKGRIQDVTDTHLTLLCFSCCQNTLWCMAVADVLTMALVLDSPSGLCLDDHALNSTTPSVAQRSGEDESPEQAV